MMNVLSDPDKLRIAAEGIKWISREYLEPRHVDYIVDLTLGFIVEDIRNGSRLMAVQHVFEELPHGLTDDELDHWLIERYSKMDYECWCATHHRTMQEWYL